MKRCDNDGAARSRRRITNRQPPKKARTMNRTTLLLTAFPDLEPAEVEEDVERLCRDLASKNLLLYGGD